MKLSGRELATVLAALRYWQQDMADGEDVPNVESSRGSDLIDGAGYFDEHEPLNEAEIDELCERLNCGESPRAQDRQQPLDLD